MHSFTPTLLPLGDRALLIRFASVLGAEANLATINFAKQLEANPPKGILEIVPNLVSVSLQYDPFTTSFDELAGEVRLLTAVDDVTSEQQTTHHTIPVRFGGEDGPDLAEVATALGMTEASFIKAHNATRLRVLATGFSPGFVYCGMHDDKLVLPRRQQVRQSVPKGSILFAAGQTAFGATPIPTGWHVIGRTEFMNFDPDRTPPTLLAAGDEISFERVK